MYGNRRFEVGSSTPDNNIDDQIGSPVGSTCVAPYVAYSNVEDGWGGPGTDNISADPEFANASAGDFRLAAGSPCIDAGTNTNIPLDVLNISRTTGHNTLPVPDLDRKPRIINCVADMGAFEHQILPGDLNEDGVVDFEDLLIVLAGWGPCPQAPAPCPGDLTEDGQINFSDALLLLGFWTQCGEGASQMGSIEECITRLGFSNPAALAACIEAMILNETP